LRSLVGADRRSHIGADSPIAEKITVRVKDRLAAYPHVNRSTRSTYGAVDKIAKRKMRVERRLMLPPFFGIRFNIRCDFPAKKADEA